MPTASTPRRRLNVLLSTLGSAGDVHPFISLGLALKARGHRATLLTNPYFQSTIEAQGLGFWPWAVLRTSSARSPIRICGTRRRGFEVVARRVIVPSIRDGIPAHRGARRCRHGGRGLQHLLGRARRTGAAPLPTASIHLQPSVIRSLIDSGMFGDMRISAAQPAWFKRALFRFIDWAAIDRILEPPLNDFRRPPRAPARAARTRPLDPLARMRHRLLPGLVCGTPGGLAPAHSSRRVSSRDGGGAGRRADRRAGVSRGRSAAHRIHSGSAAAHAHRFFIESVEAARRLGTRAML